MKKFIPYSNIQKFFCFLLISMKGPSTLLFILTSLIVSIHLPSVGFSIERYSIQNKEAIFSTELKNKHIFFVPGFMNESAQIPKLVNYFGAFKELAEKFEISYSEATALTTFKDSSYNVESIFNQIKKEAENVDKRQRKKYIAIGHSKGAAELLLMILKHPELLLSETSIIDRVILIQGAIGGSYFASEKNQNLSLSILSWFTEDALQSLNPSEANKIFGEAYSEFKAILRKIVFVKNGIQPEFFETMDPQFKSMIQDEIEKLRKQLSKKIFYITGTKEPEKLCSWIKCIHYFSTKECVEMISKVKSDGVLTLQQQRLDPKFFNAPHSCDESFGIPLTPYNFDHLQTVIHGCLGPLNTEAQIEFVYDVFNQVYQNKTGF